MTRASIGHTGKALVATPATQAIYLAIIVAALMRIGALLAAAEGSQLLDIAAVAWCVAFLGFAIAFGHCY